jgi:aminoglycoside 6'-N-acetyltransferase
VAFRPLRRADLDQVRSWLNEPHVAAWWELGEGPRAPDGEPVTAEQVEAEYGDALDDVGPTHVFVILVDGGPVGLIQWYRLPDFPDYAAAVGEPAGAGLDLFVGDPGHVGRGLGALAINRFVTSVVFAARDVDRCVAGPDVRNERSIRAFASAGFRWARDATVPGEPAPERVMVRDRER